jgi:hypothetical protein
MYKVWVTQGQGPGEKPQCEFETLKEALSYVREIEGQASFAIEYPDGTWHNWEEDLNTTAERIASDAILESLFFTFRPGSERWKPGKFIMRLPEKIREKIKKMKSKHFQHRIK